MIVDARTLPDGTVLPTTVCIIGGGPAGLTLADRLVAEGIDTVVLESGGEQPEPATQDLNEGALTGEPFFFDGVPKRLSETRLRCFGGTSYHWTGMCRPLDENDFVPRPGVPGSGWPLTAAELLPHYRRAADTCGLAAKEWDAGWWRDTLGVPLLTDATSGLDTAVFQFSPPVRFGEALGPALDAAPTARALLWANVTKLVASTDGGHVTAVEVRTLAGNQLRVTADLFVVAAGAVESARLLLVSDSEVTGGLGNQHDLVGRTFMEHPHGIGGRAHLHVSEQDLALYLLSEHTLPGGAVQHVWAGLTPSPDAQAEAEVTSGAVFFWRAGAGPPRAERDEATVAAAAAPSLAAPTGAAATPVTLAIRTEQLPNPDSRVVLRRERDALGMRRVAVDWRVTEADWRNVDTTVGLVAAALGRAGLGRVEIEPAGRPLRSYQVGIGNHHMGTARMHEDPRAGVVDASCRVHGVDNLYVCSSAVFPTAGMANPTLTIVALSHRLADHVIQSR